jgi:hypothetical protein
VVITKICLFSDFHFTGVDCAEYDSEKIRYVHFNRPEVLSFLYPSCTVSAFQYRRTSATLQFHVR